jgi:thioesterase domain-containing protein
MTLLETPIHADVRSLGERLSRMEQLFATAFSREALHKVNSVIMPLNDIGDGPSFYCVHPITGVATDFRFLAQALGPRQKFFGIQAPTEKRNAAFSCSIESISEYYVEALEKFQPDGNLVLGGFSAGAIIALEMAQRLRARGREISLLVVFDGELFNTGAEIPCWNPIYWLQLLSNLPDWIREVLLKDYTFSSFGSRLVKMAAAKGKATVEIFTGSYVIRTGHAIDGAINLERFNPHHVAFMKSLYEAQLNYVPKHYDGKLIVFAARTQGLLHLRQVKVVWHAIASAAEIVDVSSTHTSMMFPPKIQAVAAYLSKLLNSHRSEPT